MKYIILAMSFIPVAVVIIGLLMWIIPGKHSFSKDKSFRQILGKYICLIGICFFLIQLGASKKDVWFSDIDEDHICYKVLALPQDTVFLNADSTVVNKDSINVVRDTIKISIDTTVTFNTQSYNNSNVFEIPFTTKCNVRYITLNVGTAKINAIFDTGCSGAICFASKDYYKLVGAGVVEEYKFSGNQYYSIADGSTVSAAVFKLPSCTINGLTFQNITVDVSESDMTLVGNPLFKGYQITIDDTNKKLILKKNA